MSDPLDRNVLFCRMVGVLTQDQLDSLEHKTVAVGGAGGVGFTHAESLVRQGIGRIKISDLDTFGPENMGRQFGCTVHTIGRDKAEVLEERLLSINPALKVERFGAIAPSNIAAFLDGVDFVCDGVDYFNILARRLLHAEARRRRIPAMIVGPQAYGCAIFFFHPDHMSFDEYFDVNDDMPEQAQLDNWGAGLSPGKIFRHYAGAPDLDMRAKRASTVSAVCLLSTAVMAGIALRNLLNEPVAIKPVPYMYHLDMVVARFEEIHVPQGLRGLNADPERYLR
ncbi:MAG: ThiF family adenylyltransferase [Alphaproteobacteria bacterium]|nr:ThiF family adenylyltransferase [Alphaproteobacteria bacterium]